ncbi:MAG TPA: 5'-3' exonuclease H3TH domain-containing protein [Candidatus Pacearchaeota archaeon]|nr:5'-3' exonuclease H3TH domain-containing protein [Candidatus Pacearchaeota archaeon]HPO68390.1 5'-3' exonuclease H3TH domain-containing protein [Candidatus Pacearchaeota archaeon]
MMEENKIFIIIDSNALIHRAYHALPPLKTKNGELINAVYGFLLVFLKAIKEFHPEYIAAAFDLKAPTFRHNHFKEYKAKRPKMPDEFYQQIPIIKDFLKAFNVPIFEKEGFEADDIIGTISDLLSKNEKDLEIIILTGDSDIFQLINKNTKVYAPKKGLKDTLLYDEEKIREKYNLTPDQLIDFKSLKGDASDNISGVKGIGEKTAIELIRKFKNLENLYKEIENETEESKEIKERIKEILIKNKEAAFFSKMLVEIRKDAPIDFKLENCQWKGYNKKNVEELLKNYEFFTLINKLP